MVLIINFKNMKKLFLSVIVCFILIPSVSAADSLFNDVDENNKYYEAIKFAKDNGIVEGYKDGFYRPEANINRAEYLKILIETTYQNEIENAVGSDCFDDVVGDEWYAKYICFSKDLGVIVGYPDETFKPAGNINVIESLKVLLETTMDEMWEVKEGGVYDEAIEKVLQNVPETLDDIRGQWYEQYLLPTEYYSLMLDDWESFNQNITRGEMAEMVYRANFLMRDDTAVDQPEDWEIVKSYILTNSSISEDYFDEHFEYVESVINYKITDWNNYLGGRYHIGIADAVQVKYNFVIEDADEQEQVFEKSITLHNDQVIEEGYINESFYTPDGFEFTGNNKFAASSELEIAVTKEEAADIAKGNEECIDPEYFDVTTAENDLHLKALFDEIYWIWADNLSYCYINAETGDIDSVEQMLPM